MGAENQFSVNPEMPYDLRQTYANGILTPILLELEILRDKDDFSSMYKKLTMSLYTNLNQKLGLQEREDYQKLLTETISEINKYPDTFRGHDKSTEKVHKIRLVLQKLEMWLKDRMQEHGLYGSGWSDDDGL